MSSYSGNVIENMRQPITRTKKRRMLSSLVMKVIRDIALCNLFRLTFCGHHIKGLSDPKNMAKLSAQQNLLQAPITNLVIRSEANPKRTTHVDRHKDFSWQRYKNRY